MVELNRLFDMIARTREAANWQAAFGEPRAVEDKTIIPVAQVGYAFGLGFGHSTGPAETEDQPAPGGEGGGSGGGAWARPLGAVVVTPECVYFQSALDITRVALAGIAVAALFTWQLAKTLQAIFGHD
jgi:uncharacterized spore protein YtfJ